MNQHTFTYSAHGVDFPIWILWERNFIEMSAVFHLLDLEMREFRSVMAEFHDACIKNDISKVIQFDGFEFLEFDGLLAIIHLILYKLVNGAKRYKNFRYEKWLEFNNLSAKQNCLRDLHLSAIKKWDNETIANHEFN